MLIFAAFGVLLAAGALVTAYWLLRPNTARVEPALQVETWPAVADGTHNSNTDMLWWRDAFYMVHATSPWHLSSRKCKLVVRRSPDGRQWERLAEVANPHGDIRDPKFLAQDSTLYMYSLRNDTQHPHPSINPEPYGTQVTATRDGVHWEELRDCEPTGWLFWRPKTRDGKTWYLPAYWWEHGKSVLLQSTDGEHWTIVSEIYAGDKNDETAIEFLPDGRMIATARLEVTGNWFGHKDACTLIAVADPPYTEWTRSKNYVTRLDGPCLFSYEGKLFAVGRHNPEPPFWPTYFGSIVGKKRTALYQVLEDRLVHLSDLPSAGDTSYAGVVLRDGFAYICYYTSRTDRDYPWIVGMMLSSDIMMARVPLDTLLAQAS